MSLTGNFCEDDTEEINGGYPSTHGEQYTEEDIKKSKHIIRISRTSKAGGYIYSDDEYHEALRVLRGG